jgi:hypothetical protein
MFMNSNDLEKLKADLVKKLFNGTDNRKNLQDKSALNQNIKYRYSNPWTTLLSAAKVLGDECQISQNLSLRNNFEINDHQGQLVFDAAFIKAVKYLAEEMDLDEDDLKGTVAHYIIKRKLLGKSVFEVVGTLKKLRPDMIDST